MKNSTLYLGALTIALCFAYFVLSFFFAYFFKDERARFSMRSFYSVFVIAVLSAISYIGSLSIPNAELGNRTLHISGGGFLAFVICFLVVKDQHITLTKFRFFVFAALVVTAMGVANELIEFFLQHATNYFVFYRTAEDTWWDLASNTVGLLIAGAVFVPFIGRRLK